MTDPNALIGKYGEKVKLIRVTNAVYDAYDELDESASSIEEVMIDAWVSQPSEEETSRLEGKAALDSLKATVDSSTDISSQRDGGPDEIERNGKRYKVAVVRDDSHPMANAEKKTVLLEPRAGR